MGLLAAIRDLRRRVAGTRVVRLTHYRGLPDAGVVLTRENVDAVVRDHLAAGRLRLLRRWRLAIFGDWRRYRFAPPTS